METRNFVISFDKHKCRIGDQRGTLKTVSIIETLPNGKRKTIHSDIHFESDDQTPGYKSLLRFIRLPDKDKQRRAA